MVDTGNLFAKGAWSISDLSLRRLNLSATKYLYDSAAKLQIPFNLVQRSQVSRSVSSRHDPSH